MKKKKKRAPGGVLENRAGGAAGLLLFAPMIRSRVISIFQRAVRGRMGAGIMVMARFSGSLTIVRDLRAFQNYALEILSPLSSFSLARKRARILRI